MTYPPVAASEDLQQSFKSALKVPTNITIKLDIFTWNVHAELLASNSEFFKYFIEDSTWKENEERCVKILDDNEWMLARMLQFLYYGYYDYDQDVPQYENAVSLADLVQGGCRKVTDAEPDPNFCMRVDLRMLQLGTKYCFGALKSHALAELRSYNGETFIKVVEDYCLYRINRHPGLKELVAERISNLYNELKEAQGVEEWNAGIGKWLRDDHELCIMVMDELAKSSRH
ncbi:hypothetical protein LTR70_001369 [Exophiala xenobiotica]|uniref:BTB domain-containing protein n=1 Tax=Lithohypha guttulata TaxID=1690604 RepID=A0ABR0KMP8_9EURO|nr:hypothetical protein LTR24_000876 [Lithohypha guttulata]KAK5328048.1 hypothetical protein LTR70_001369 [Exophiala xenobiotica]